MAKKKTQTKAEIVRISRQKFSTFGYAATSLTAIAETVGIKKASIYYFFSSKADLFFQVLREVIDQQQEIFSVEIGEETPEEVLTNTIAAAVVAGQSSGYILQIPAEVTDSATADARMEIVAAAQVAIEKVADLCARCGVANPQQGALVIVDTNQGFIRRSQLSSMVGVSQTPGEHARAVARMLLSSS